MDRLRKKASKVSVGAPGLPTACFSRVCGWCRWAKALPAERLTCAKAHHACGWLLGASSCGQVIEYLNRQLTERDLKAMPTQTLSVPFKSPFPSRSLGRKASDQQCLGGAAK